MPLFPRLELCLAGGRFCAPDSLRTDGNDQGGPGRRAVVGVGAAVALAKELEKELACRESTHYCARLLPHSLTSSSTLLEIDVVTKMLLEPALSVRAIWKAAARRVGSSITRPIRLPAATVQPAVVVGQACSYVWTAAVSICGCQCGEPSAQSHSTDHQPGQISRGYWLAPRDFDLRPSRAALTHPSSLPCDLSGRFRHQPL